MAFVHCFWYKITMLPWQSARWMIPLESPPTVLQMGVGKHGHRPVEHYRLDALWCLHLYRYEADLRINDQAFPIRPGHVSVTPPGAALEYRYQGPSVHAYAHFAFADAPAGAARGVFIPAMQPLGDDFAAIARSFEHAIGSFSTQRARAEARVWDLLWQLAERATNPSAEPPGMHPAVAQTLQTIELGLGEPLRVADLARAVGLSHNHLIRLFRTAVGTTIVGYLRERRLERARHLLTHTTLPIKAIASQVGIGDLHQFNKAVRTGLGVSPRQVRQKT